MPLPSLCIASNNSHKLEELSFMLQGFFDVKSMQELGFTEDIEETGATFHENASIKSRAIFGKIGIPVLSDDSGLQVYALDMEPGVYSARYAGTHGDHAANIQKVLQKLSDIENTEARFISVLSYIDAQGKEFYFEGTVDGHIVRSPSGIGGFGYDPIFIPSGYTHTFAEMSDIQKNQLSHRGRAIQQFLSFLGSN
ncbi:MAG: RdgB/HAM1 family non-canonical purine NTP pyrophosphatase [Leadbetterella sp.]